MAAIIYIMDDILKTDETVLYDFLGTIDVIIPQEDLVGEVIGYFQKYKVIDILALAKEASLL